MFGAKNQGFVVVPFLLVYTISRTYWRNVVNRACPAWKSRRKRHLVYSLPSPDHLPVLIHCTKIYPDFTQICVSDFNSSRTAILVHLSTDEFQICCSIENASFYTLLGIFGSTWYSTSSVSLISQKLLHQYGNFMIEEKIIP